MGQLTHFYRVFWFFYMPVLYIHIFVRRIQRNYQDALSTFNIDPLPIYMVYS